MSISMNPRCGSSDDASGEQVLFVDDEEVMRLSVRQWLRLAGFDVSTYDAPEAALGRVDRFFPGILVSDVRMPRIDGLEVLRRARERDPDIPVLLVTGHGEVAMAVEAMRRGAYDFIEKPFAPELLVDAIRRACEKRRLTLENRRLHQQVDQGGIEARILGTSPAIDRLRREVLDLAQANVSVIVNGETGAGKELVARCLHDFSPRAKGNFVPVNCGAIPENMFESELFGHEAGAFTGALKRRVGRIEHAHRGTLFLDEVESMPLNGQVKLLRVLQERVVERLGSNTEVPADVRTVAASKVDLDAASEQGTFRSDLYFRLAVAEVRVPPLRERREDVPLLFEYFAASAARAHGRELQSLSAALLIDLAARPWPGNVRELRNAAERYALGLGGTVRLAAAVSNGAEAGLPLPEQVDRFEQRAIEETLRRCQGNVALALEQLGIPRRTLNEKMARYGIDRAKYL